MASVKCGVTAQAVIHHYHRSETGITIINVKRWRAVLPWLVVRGTGQLSAGLPCRLVSSGFACFVIA